MAVLEITSGPEQGKTVDLSAEEPAVFGRDASCTVQITDVLSSRRHFQVLRDGDAYVLEDLGSSNGTLLNEEAVTRKPLSDGDEIRLGETRIRFSDPAGGRAPGSGRKGRRDDPLVGGTLGGYRIESFIGRGGMGAVYQATQMSLNRVVALKVLNTRLTSDEKFIDMFIKEARAAGALNHPNIVQVYDVGEDGGHHFFSMELMPRGSVGDRLKELGKLSVPKALEAVIHAAKGLEYAEKKNLVHCDIKPDNLMLSEDGAVKIGDLGLSKNVQRDEESGESDVVFGTPHFIAPEQAQRQKVDHRADIYSLGAAFYLMLTGRTPYSGDSGRDIALKHVREPLTPVTEVNPEIPATVSRIVTRMMAKDPKDRYQNATALLEDLRKANIEVNPAAAYTDGFPGIPLSDARGRGRGLLLAAAAAAAVLIVLVLLALGVFSGGDEAPPAPGPGPQPLTPRPGDGKDDEEERRRLEDERRRIEEDRRRLREEKARSAHEAAVAFEEKHGALHPKTLEKYAAAAKAFADTSWGRKAAERRDAIRANLEARRQREEDARLALEELEGKANLLMKDHYFGKAMAAFDAFDAARFQGTAAASKLGSRRQFVRDKASSTYAHLASEAQAATAAGDFDRARTILGRVVERFGIDTFTAKARKALRNVDAEADRRRLEAEKRREEADRALFEQTRDACREKAAAFDLDGAEKAARRLAENTADGGLRTDAYRAKARALLSDLVHLRRLFRQVVAAVNARGGKLSLRIAKVSQDRDARVLSADEEGIRIQVGPGKTGLDWTELTAGEYHDLACEALTRNPDSELLLAVHAFFFGGGLLGRVNEHLTRALEAEHPAIRKAAEDLRERLFSGSSDAARQIEDQARALFEAFQTLFDKASQEPDPDKAVELLEQARARLEELREKFGHTKFVRELGGK